MSSSIETIVEIGTSLEVLVDVLGEQGLSAYQVAVANGFNGTEEEWLLSLSSGGISFGSGFQIVGTEVRYDFQSLARA